MVKHDSFECGSFFLFLRMFVSGEGGDIMFDLIFDILILSIELASLIFQIREYKKNNRTDDAVVVIIIKV